MSENTIVAAATTKTALTCEQFVANAERFLNERCPLGSGIAVNRKEVALAGGLTEESDALISALINAGFMPNWRIRQGRDGGVCRVGEEPTRGPNINKYGSDWLSSLMTCLNNLVSLDPKKPTPRDKIAHALAAMTGEDVLKVPNKISEAISMGKCPGFASKRGAGIYRTGEVVEAPAVSAEGIDEAAEAATETSASAEASVEAATEVVETATVETTEVSVELSAVETSETVETQEVVDAPTDASAEVSEASEASQETAPETTPDTSKAKGRRNRKS